MSPVGIVLAGGASSRFGGDKLAAPFRGRPVLEHALSALAAVADHVVLVLAPEDSLPVLRGDLWPRLLVARDPAPHEGPLAGLATGLAALPDADGEAVAVVVAGDMPTLVPAVLRLLAGTLEDAPSQGAARLGVEPLAPLPLAVRVAETALAVEVLLAGGHRRLRDLFEAVPTAVVPAATWLELDPEAATLRDIDTPADLSER
jgi:molybdopterin-guanine dinucleotide biosynthesis protein A